MQLYILRHGIAVDRAPSGRDADRELTPEGRTKLNAVLRQAARAGVSPNVILTSPLVRARQTAEMAAAVLKYAGKVVEIGALEPDAPVEGVWKQVQDREDAPQVLLAGHNPQVSRLAGYLLGVPDLAVDFKKGALLRIDFDSFGRRPRGVLRWLLTARVAGADNDD